jgi:hypothetical protein
MLVRGARPEDGDAIARVRIASWRGAYAGITPDTCLDPNLLLNSLSAASGHSGTWSARSLAS